jgi:ubiquinone/menaquinone biosynthesis C-methylase UbiE
VSIVCGFCKHKLGVGEKVVNRDKEQVHDFWNEASCGESLYLTEADQTGYESQAMDRYKLEPYILEFADFDNAKDKVVLEIGVGLGADHQRFAESGADLYGIDLTERAIEHTRRRLASLKLSSQLAIGDAEQLDAPDEFFDSVYSWGVLHHSPDTAKAVAEVKRVLKTGGEAKIMIYSKWSMVGMMLWIRYALLRLRPNTSLKEIYASYLESPGTKAYSFKEARRLFKGFSEVNIHTVLSHGDLLESSAGQRHEGSLLFVARKIIPRWFIRRFLPNTGLFMLIEARK